MFDGIVDSIKQQFIESIEQNLEMQREGLGNFGNLLSQNTENFNPTTFSMIAQIMEQIMLPIAGVILTYVVVYDLIQMVMESNNMYEHQAWHVYVWIFKTSIAILLISNSFTLTNALIEAGGEVVQKIIPYATEEPTIANQFKSISEALKELSLLDLMIVNTSQIFTVLVHYFVKLMVMAIIVGRFIQIYLYSSVAPIPFATFTSRQWQSTGVNYLKNMIALALQGAIIFVALAIYNAISTSLPFESVTKQTTGLNIAWIFLESLVAVIALSVTVGQSRRIAQSIVDAH
ncbi:MULTISPECIES: VirB6/TrbL-like conjugal transfer protein, CD1112 family [unclassified Aerococcus]|uniref:VirB6/TrbL-like conjugal transfer protein, CD1112 family n=1 Tax=unclassified Aerococcus TaxID=2618060 RepID=UPI0008A1FF90|nr:MULTISPECIES: CD0415/CD1112 family protein [unclassified Aerococcus]MDK6679196.1 CD0415/CD1112 family protein [Aerococcus sp. UMB8608]MDK6685962.1 CD0415/CD1112 family protein [Aerococcus sp. UMB8623]MDK6940767.1 CD0415/CD1112 family protein [Aerococcus sp. UMB8487]OFK21383.1 hypothetical protein HMPREF2829_03710 [Aerococcus sp. HMSC072A12]OFR32583.1 hypothetical protein HMPREF2892_08195 [Aerococcus sp. HMSC061A03]